jgi:DNA-binding MarR family transcriptional regulator
MSSMTRRLGEEIRTTCMAQALRRAARTVSRDYDAALSDSGLTIGQLSTLAALDSEGALRLGELANGLGMDRTTLNRNLDPLEKKGLVQSLPVADDARARAISLTAEGRAKLVQAAPAWRRAQATLFKKIPGWPLIGPALDAIQ